MRQNEGMAYSGRKAGKRILDKLNGNMAQGLYLVILALYPLRHIHWGLDLWDTGYNYANFEYMGLEHMDSMWLFSTYLSNVVGNLLMKLPMAGTLAGMNFYTGLFVSVLALMGYFFCTKKLGISPFVTFLGEAAAVSLCWCPTALLYNYLTYVLFLGGVIFLYLGLTEEKKWWLFAAGICLGTNVLVRFPNLPEAALIVAVWAYGVIEGLEKRKGWMRNTLHRTLWCLSGYVTALILFFSYIHIRYGMDAYVSGIQRLFSMTDRATDYKATSMILGIVDAYRENLYWVVRIGFIAGVGMAGFGLLAFLTKRVAFFKERKGLSKGLETAARIVWLAVCAAMIGWLYYRGFCATEYYGYGAILRPAILFMLLAMVLAAVRILQKDCPKEEKLISGMLILVILLTSIGSNNGVYPSMNNLFVAAPYTLWECQRFCKRNLSWIFPAKGVLVAFLGLFMVQSILFGANFVFVEATGAQNVTATVDNNEVLKGIKMNPERAKWMEELSAYAEEKEFAGREVILYGGLPALSYYLQMPSAFNPWSDLDSYSVDTMKGALYRTQEKKISANRKPVVIVEQKYVRFLDGGRNALEQDGVGETEIQKIEKDEKWPLLLEYLENNNYERTFSNDKFTVWE